MPRCWPTQIAEQIDLACAVSPCQERPDRGCSITIPFEKVATDDADRAAWLGIAEDGMELARSALRSVIFIKSSGGRTQLSVSCLWLPAAALVPWQALYVRPLTHGRVPLIERRAGADSTRLTAGPL
jgi:hypothetical protein